MYDVLLGRVAPRRVLSLLRGLPNDSDTKQVLRAHQEERPEGTYLGWGIAETYSALIYEQMLFQRHEFGRAHGAKSAKIQPLELPGREVVKKVNGMASLRGKAMRDAGDY